MPLQLNITAESGPELAIHIRNFVAALQLNVNPVVNDNSPAANVGTVAPAPTVQPAAEEKKPEPEKKPAAKKAAKEAVAEVKTSTFTLQNAIDRATEAAGDCKDEKIMAALRELNTSFGVAKVRELPPEKLDAYMEALDKAFPKQGEILPPATGGMFD